MSDERTSDEKAKDYYAMGHSVDLIHAIIAGTENAEESAAYRQDRVDRNVEHLELMVAKSDWVSEDMADSNSAITAGKAYTAA